MIDLDELERIAKAATQGTREIDMLFNIVANHEIIIHTFEEYGHTTSPSKANVRYIAAACNAAPELIQRIRELEAEADILAELLAPANGNPEFDVKYWRNWAREKRE